MCSNLGIPYRTRGGAVGRGEGEDEDGAGSSEAVGVGAQGTRWHVWRCEAGMEVEDD